MYCSSNYSTAKISESIGEKDLSESGNKVTVVRIDPLEELWLESGM